MPEPVIALILMSFVILLSSIPAILSAVTGEERKQGKVDAFYLAERAALDALISASADASSCIAAMKRAYRAASPYLSDSEVDAYHLTLDEILFLSDAKEQPPQGARPAQRGK